MITRFADLELALAPDGIRVTCDDRGRLPELFRLVQEALQPSPGLRAALAYVDAHGEATSSELAVHLGTTAANASNKLVALARAGFILRAARRCQPSGGAEWVYRRKTRGEGE